MAVLACSPEIIGGDTTGPTGTTTGGASSGTAGCAADPAIGDPGNDPSCGVEGAGPIPGMKTAIAIRNASNGWLEVNISTSEAASCADKYAFPADCGSAQRVRLDLSPEQQALGVYKTGGPSSVFAYLDVQAPWEKAGCSNLGGGDILGTLRITSIDEHVITGSLCGTNKINGTFVAPICCNTCKGTGQTCFIDAECCNLYCGSGTCDP